MSRINSLKKRLDAIVKEQKIIEYPYQCWCKENIDESNLWECKYLDDGTFESQYKSDEEIEAIRDRPNTLFLEVDFV